MRYLLVGLLVLSLSGAARGGRYEDISRRVASGCQDSKLEKLESRLRDLEIRMLDLEDKKALAELLKLLDQVRQKVK